MCIRVIFEKNPNNIIMGVDTDGGPFITVGWKNDEIEVMEIKTIKDIDGKKQMLFNLKEIENKLEHFFYVCNQYLSGKEFVYKPKSFEYAITVQSRNGSQKEMNIEQLSSGEKQIVALFSYIY